MDKWLMCLSIHIAVLQDHKRALDGDGGLNTGGMGAYAPTPLITPKQYQECMHIVQVNVQPI